MTTIDSEEKIKCPKCGQRIHFVWLGGDLVLYLCEFCNTEYVTTLNHAVKNGHIQEAHI